MLCFSGRLTFPCGKLFETLSSLDFLLAKQNTSRYEVDFRRGCFKQMERSTFHLKQWVKWWGPHKKDYFELKGRLYIIVSGHFFFRAAQLCLTIKNCFFWTHFPQSNFKEEWFSGNFNSGRVRVQTWGSLSHPTWCWLQLQDMKHHKRKWLGSWWFFFSDPPKKITPKIEPNPL